MVNMMEIEISSENATKALEVLVRYGQIDGAHHKTWVIDQAVRALIGNYYDKFVTEFCSGEDGPNTYEWDEGIPP